MIKRREWRSKPCTRRFQRNADDNTWRESPTTWQIPFGRFTASAVSENGQTIYLAASASTQQKVADGTLIDVFAAPHRVFAVSSSSGQLLWQHDLTIGPKKSHANYSAEPINSLAIVPRTNKVAVALWDGRVAIVGP